MDNSQHGQREASPASSPVTDVQVSLTGLGTRHRNGRGHGISRSLAIGELFAGAGGMALGASRARHQDIGLQHVWATDNNRDACDTFRLNIDIEPNRVICSDVANLDMGELPAIDGLIFGFPCNDFSVVGERRGIKGDYGGLYQFGVRALEHFKPMFFVAENVTGLASVNRRADFDRILSELEGAGYDVWPNLVKFEQFGVAQRRRRIIIAGFRKELNVTYSSPTPTFGPELTAREALADIPRDCANNERTVQSEQVVARLRYIKPGQNAFTAKLPKRLRLNMRSNAMISQIYRRLVPDEPSYTITGSGGGGTHIYHWEEDRALTNRERARLQSFPDTFVFSGNKESVRRQIGMAVPPQGAEAIFNNVLKMVKQHRLA